MFHLTEADAIKDEQGNVRQSGERRHPQFLHNLMEISSGIGVKQM